MDLLLGALVGGALVGSLVVLHGLLIAAPHEVDEADAEALELDEDLLLWLATEDAVVRDLLAAAESEAARELVVATHGASWVRRLREAEHARDRIVRRQRRRHRLWRRARWRVAGLPPLRVPGREAPAYLRGWSALAGRSERNAA